MYSERIEIPTGLGMALMKDSRIFNFFAGLPTEKKKLIINETHYINSKEEMQEIVNALAYDIDLQ